MSDYNEQMDIAKKVMKEDSETLGKISQHKSIGKLREEYSHLDIYINDLEQRLKDYEKFSVRTCPPTKSYKELEEKVAKADELRQKDIDELWETRITPLQNKLKDQHTQIEALYKRENQHIKEIKDLKDTIHDAETVINFAVGYISATQPHTDKHPMEVKKWLYEGIFKD